MARKSKAEIEAGVLAKQEEINKAAEERAMVLFQGFMGKFMEQIVAAKGTPAAPIGGDDRKLAESLTHAMLAASATPSKRATLVKPEERLERETAQKEMFDLIIKYNAEGIVPAYRVTRKTFIAETLVDPQFRDQQTKQMVDQEVNWRGVPNQAMTPIIRVPNGAQDERSIEAGRAVYALYQRMLGNQPVLNANASSNWVTSGKELLRGNPSPGVSPIANIAPGDDPRRLGAAQGATTIRMLGKTADPAVVTP